MAMKKMGCAKCWSDEEVENCTLPFDLIVSSSPCTGTYTHLDPGTLQYLSEGVRPYLIWYPKSKTCPGTLAGNFIAIFLN